MAINLTGLASLVFALLALRTYQSIDPASAALVTIAAYAGPIAMLELVLLRTFARPSAGFEMTGYHSLALGRVLIKLIGFYATIALIGGLYWIFPEYVFDQHSFYRHYWKALQLIAPWITGGAPLYFVVVDRYIRHPFDGYWQMGCLVTGRFSRIDKGILAQHLLGWLVKGFFLALMFSYLTDDLIYFREVNINEVLTSFQRLYDFLWRSLFLLDVTLASVGYTFTLRILDSHIRSTDPTMIGWISCIICYEPFWSLINKQYLAYDTHDVTWGSWLAEEPIFYCIWGCIILILVGIYVLSTVAFGLRFSNLTHRGILTNGPFRYCKHPAYVSKNLSWWMISVPFLANGSHIEALKYSTMLLILNWIYFLRARTEERHLSRDPRYVEYALAMNDRGVFCWAGKLFPVLQYRPNPVPKTAIMPPMKYD